MPAPINLAGKTFGKLKAVRLLKERDKHGRRLWLCHCECGAEVPVCRKLLQNGHKTSCGRTCPLRKTKRHEGMFSKGEARAQHKQTKRIIDEQGKEWLALRAAARYISKSSVTILKWSDERHGCPDLQGRCIETRLFKTAYNREIAYYSKDDFDRIKEARKDRLRIPEYPGLVHVFVAAKELGVSPRTLRRLLEQYGEKAEDKNGKSSDGRSLVRSYVRVEFVEAVKADRLKAKPKDRITRRDAAELLGVSINTFNGFERRGSLKPTPGGTRKNGVLFSRSEVESLKQGRASSASMPDVFSNKKPTTTRANGPMEDEGELRDINNWPMRVSDFSKQALDQLRNVIGSATPDDTSKEQDSRSSEFGYSPDFKSVNWGKELFSFTTQQGACIRVMWEAKQRGVMDLDQVTILGEAESALADSDKPQLRRLFKKQDGTMHPAWGKMIVQNGQAGRFRLADPPQ